MAVENYRHWLLAAIKAMNPEAVVLITARPENHRAATMANIAQKCDGWQPDMAIFNEERDRAPVCKEKLLHKYVFPKYGTDGSRYLAIESNPRTHAMYERYGIYGLQVHVPNFASGNKSQKTDKQMPLF